MFFLWLNGFDLMSKVVYSGKYYLPDVVGVVRKPLLGKLGRLFVYMVMVGILSFSLMANLFVASLGWSLLLPSVLLCSLLFSRRGGLGYAVLRQEYHKNKSIGKRSAWRI